MKPGLKAESGRDTQPKIGAIVTTGLSIPASVQALLMARLDTFGPEARYVAQIGAVIGREFPHQLIAALAGMSELEVEMSLARLVSGGLLVIRGVAPQARYMFKHDLIREAAYGTLLRQSRRELHTRITAMQGVGSGITRQTASQILHKEDEHHDEYALRETRNSLRGSAQRDGSTQFAEIQGFRQVA